MQAKPSTVLTPRKDTFQFLKVPGKTLFSPDKDKTTGSAQLGLCCICGQNIMDIKWAQLLDCQNVLNCTNTNGSKEEHYSLRVH